MKHHLLGNPIGELALNFRDKFDILRTAYFEPEKVGMLANDQLATKLVTRICQSHKTFIDVGAHIGSVMSQVRLRDSTIKIVAVEAIPEKVAHLKRKFPFAELHCCAVGESSGEVPLFINLRQSGYSSLIRPVKITKAEISEITVRLERLDKIVLANDIDVIKIDVEGAELSVLNGSTKILNENRPTIMFESAYQLESGFWVEAKEKLYDFFFTRDYVVVVPNRVAHNDIGLSKDVFIESHFYPRRTTNFFAIPKERRIEIRDRTRSILKVSAP